MLLRWQPRKQFPIAGLQPIEVGVSSLATSPATAQCGSAWPCMAEASGCSECWLRAGRHFGVPGLDGSSLTVLTLIYRPRWRALGRHGQSRHSSVSPANKVDHFDSRDGLSGNWVSQLLSGSRGYPVDRYGQGS